MVNLIIGSSPESGQTVLGTVALHGIEPQDASIVEFSEKLSVMRSAEFETVSARMQPLLELMQG
jgi:hypothetical protein